MDTPVLANSSVWSPLKKLGFRFSFIFILSFILLKNNGTFPLFNIISKPFIALSQQFTPWFAKHILHYQYDYAIFTNGSGDTSYDWVVLLVLFLLALLGSAIWSLLDRKRKNYDIGYYWLTLFIRYYIALMLINYGAIKLTHSQMPAPGLSRLMQPLNEFSPMGLAWTFMGFSKGYNIFVGLVEISAAFLLFRRTLVLGALVTIATSINIMSINYFFDVPVKQLSTALLFLSIFLLLPYLRPLNNFFFKGEPAQLQLLARPVFQKKWLKKGAPWLKIGFIAFVVITQVMGLFSRQKLMDHYFKKSPLYGIYRIEDKNSELYTLPSDWSYLIFEGENQVTIRDRYYKAHYEETRPDTTAKTISLNNFTFDYQVADNGDIVLKKTLEKGVEEIKLIKQNTTDFELNKRSFSWIQEYPYNR
ncbi:hypothetical protein E2P86_06350 [Sphingobacterium psychroaquaticum]|uniref:hypothetical protein n=1 Tax=Sphingobacterium psychroaquaticum TaxID=561061 RepID=UPI0010697FFF|nr:hypothetical protein [Sphingobacterium psychroaquaticum]QBQ40792.1 hypothetical protein E2P86_06350 [Sphingobacterium psychroaquaticum]